MKFINMACVIVMHLNNACLNYFSACGAGPTDDILIEFEIWPKFGVLWFKVYITNHNKILHTSRQLHCRDVCKIS